MIQPTLCVVCNQPTGMMRHGIATTWYQCDCQVEAKTLAVWAHPSPHFNGIGSHRYDGRERTDGDETKCVYCNRPINFKSEE